MKHEATMQEMRRLSEQAYQCLKLENGASLALIEQAYQRLMLKYHPDRHPDHPDAWARFNAICSAHAILTGPQTMLEELARQNLTQRDVVNAGSSDYFRWQKEPMLTPPPTYYVPAPDEESSLSAVSPVVPFVRPAPSAPPMASFDRPVESAVRQAESKENMARVMHFLSLVCRLIGKLTQLLLVAMYYENERRRHYRVRPMVHIRSTYLNFGFWGVRQTECYEQSHDNVLGVYGCNG